MGNEHELKNEQGLKLAMLGSFVRSQQALAQILEHTAAMLGHISAVGEAGLVRKQIGAIYRMQAALTKAMLQIDVGEPEPVRCSIPGKPWLHKKVRQGGG